MKRVYTCFCTDVIHEGHRNIIREAVKYGELTIGVLSDAAMIRFNRFPTISFEERMQLVKDIPEVSNVVVQDDVMYDKVIEELRPDYVIHGDNWQEGPLKAIPAHHFKILLIYDCNRKFCSVQICRDDFSRQYIRYTGDGFDFFHQRIIQWVVL